MNIDLDDQELGMLAYSLSVYISEIDKAIALRMAENRPTSRDVEANYQKAKKLLFKLRNNTAPRKDIITNE